MPDSKLIETSFAVAVNMTAGELDQWLASPESLAVGWKGSNEEREESVGHSSGRQVLQILRKRNADLSESDYAHMRKVVGFVKRHLAQRPDTMVTSRWRYSLMNWGHDPLKD